MERCGAVAVLGVIGEIDRGGTGFGIDSYRPGRCGGLIYRVENS